MVYSSLPLPSIPTAASLLHPPLFLHKIISFSLVLSLPDSLTHFPPTSLVCQCLWQCTRKSCYCLPLQAAYICLLSVETKETDHKAYYGARSGIHAACVCPAPIDTHRHTTPLPISSSLSSCDSSHMVSRQAAQ